MLRWLRDRRSRSRFAVIAALAMAGLYLLLYYPHRPDSVAGRALGWYVTLQARLAGGCLRLFDADVSVTGTVISGRFPLRIVLDCSALDAMVLFAAATVAFPARARVKAVGLAAGIAAIAAFNVARIVALYAAGAFWPASFDILHEEVMQILVVLVAAGAFVAYTRWCRAEDATHARA